MEEGGNLVFNGALENELRTEAAHLRQPVRVVDPVDEQLLDLVLDALAGCYSVHGVVLLSVASSLPQEPTPFYFPAVLGRHLPILLTG
jgi:hypothetical protein